MDVSDIEEIYASLTPSQRVELDHLIAMEMQENLWRPLVNVNDLSKATPQEMAANSEADILLYGGAAGGGKLLACSGTFIPSEDGFIEMGDIRVGDTIYSADGSPTKVIFVSEIESPEDSYEIEFSTGEKIKACGRHLWLTMTENERTQALRADSGWRERRRAKRPSRAVKDSKKPWVSEGLAKRNSEREYECNPPSEGEVRTTEEILNTLHWHGSRVNHSIAVCSAVQFPRKDLLIDPYLLGLWLGDGTTKAGMIGMLEEDFSDVMEFLDEEVVSESLKTKDRKRPYMTKRFGKLQQNLRTVGVLGNKRIPAEYLRSSVSQRIALLQGIMDTDGTVDSRGQCEIGFSNEALTKDTLELISSLGIKATMRSKEMKSDNHATRYRIKFVSDIPVFRLGRKLARQKVSDLRPTTQRRYIVDIRKIDPEPMRCIQVDHPSGLYLVTPSFISTHNTNLVCGLALTRHKRSIIYRREINQAASMSEEIFNIRGRRDGWNGHDKVFRLPGNQLIRLAGMQLESDKQKFKGIPFDLIAFDEVTDFLETQFRFVTTWNRSPDPNQRCRVIATCNPPSTADGMWIVEYWGPWLDPNHPNPALPGELRYYTTDERGRDVEVETGEPFERNGEIIVPRSRTFIPSSIDDNPYLMATSYKSNLQALPEPLRSQMLKGDFMAGKEDNEWQVIPTAWVEEAQARWKERKPRGLKMTALGVDPARGGRDETVLAPRYDWWYGELIVKEGVATKSGGEVASLCLHHVKDGAPIYIDVIGGAGTSPYDHMKMNGINVVAVDGRNESHGRESSGKFGFVNKRSEMWWRMREALDPETGDGLALPPDRKLLAELCTPRWTITPRGIQVESKGTEKENTGIIKRLGRSPNRGDAVVYALLQEGSRGSLVRNRPTKAKSTYSPHNWRRTRGR